jgi:hypothetical protein
LDAGSDPVPTVSTGSSTSGSGVESVRRYIALTKVDPRMSNKTWRSLMRLITLQFRAYQTWAMGACAPPTRASASSGLSFSSPSPGSILGTGTTASGSTAAASSATTAAATVTLSGSSEGTATSVATSEEGESDSGSRGKISTCPAGDQLSDASAHADDSSGGGRHTPPSAPFSLFAAPGYGSPQANADFNRIAAAVSAHILGTRHCGASVDTGAFSRGGGAGSLLLDEYDCDKDEFDLDTLDPADRANDADSGFGFDGVSAVSAWTRDDLSDRFFDGQMGYGKANGFIGGARVCSPRGAGIDQQLLVPPESAIARPLFVLPEHGHGGKPKAAAGVGDCRDSVSGMSVGAAGKLDAADASAPAEAGSVDDPKPCGDSAAPAGATAGPYAHLMQQWNALAEKVVTDSAYDLATLNSRLLAIVRAQSAELDAATGGAKPLGPAAAAEAELATPFAAAPIPEALKQRAVPQRRPQNVVDGLVFAATTLSARAGPQALLRQMMKNLSSTKPVNANNITTTSVTNQQGLSGSSVTGGSVREWGSSVSHPRVLGISKATRGGSSGNLSALSDGLSLRGARTGAGRQQQVPASASAKTLGALPSPGGSMAALSPGPLSPSLVNSAVSFPVIGSVAGGASSVGGSAAGPGSVTSVGTAHTAGTAAGGSGLNPRNAGSAAAANGVTSAGSSSGGNAANAGPIISSIPPGVMANTGSGASVSSERSGKHKNLHAQTGAGASEAGRASPARSRLHGQAATLAGGNAGAGLDASNSTGNAGNSNNNNNRGNSGGRLAAGGAGGGSSQKGESRSKKHQQQQQQQQQQHDQQALSEAAAAAVSQFAAAFGNPHMMFPGAAAEMPMLLGFAPPGGGMGASAQTPVLMHNHVAGSAVPYIMMQQGPGVTGTYSAPQSPQIYFVAPAQANQADYQNQYSTAPVYQYVFAPTTGMMQPHT